MSPEEAMARALTKYMDPLPEFDHLYDCPAGEKVDGVCICPQLARIEREAAAEERREYKEER